MDNMECALASALAAPLTGELSDTAIYRKYVAGLTTRLTMAGNEDTAYKRILYEVGRRSDTVAGCMKTCDPNTPRISSAYPTGAVMSEAFTGLAKKFSNFSGIFSHGALGGIAERIAKGLAASSVFENKVEAVTLAGGRPITVQALGVFDVPASAGMSTVFIPRLVDTVTDPDVFSVLVAAATGEGATVASDVVEVDAVSRAPLIRNVRADGFPQAAVAALRVIGANMIAADAGDLFSLAVTRGVHHTLSVVAHTDEGGVMRDVLRAGAFMVPFGGIHCGLSEYLGLPLLTSSSKEVVAAYVDGIALKSAALVSHCDPGLVHQGRWFPTVLEGYNGSHPLAEAGEVLPCQAGMATANRDQLARNIGGFAGPYVAALSKLFGAPGNSRAAIDMITAPCTLLGDTNRHLMWPTVAPYYWVEPTSLIPHDFTGYVAETNGCGAYATRDIDRSVPAWEGLERVGAVNPMCADYVASFRGARTAPFLAHLSGHRLNGLSCIVPKQFDPAGILHPGACATHRPVSARAANGVHIQHYLWTRGQSPLPAPAEFMCLGGAMAFSVRHMNFDADGLPRPEHVPAASEMCGAEVRFSVSIPVGFTCGPLGKLDTRATRARVLAARALAGSAARNAAGGLGAQMGLPVMMSTPVLSSLAAGRAVPLASRDNLPDMSGSGAAVEPAIQGSNVKRADINVQHSASLPPTLHNAPLRAPGLATQARIGGGGGGQVGVPMPARPAGEGADAPVSSVESAGAHPTIESAAAAPHSGAAVSA